MYKDIDEHITSSSAVEGLGRGGGASGAEEGAVEGHGSRGGGARARAVEAARGRRGRRRCHGRRTDAVEAARGRRAAVFDEEEDERIDLRQALEVIYQRELLLVPATNRE